MLLSDATTYENDSSSSSSSAFSSRTRTTFLMRSRAPNALPCPAKPITLN